MPFLIRLLIRSLIRPLPLLFLLAAGSATAQGGLNAAALVATYPAGSIQSIETAERALKDVEQTRLAIEAARQAEEQLCYPKFFTTSCLEQVRERRRDALEKTRPIEVEAHTWQRRAKAAERDKKLVAKLAEDDAESRRREERQAQNVAEANAAKSNVLNDAEVIAEQKKRADNITAFERKQREFAERMKEAQTRRVAKEASAAAKEASAAAKPAPK